MVQRFGQEGMCFLLPIDALTPYFVFNLYASFRSCWSYFNIALVFLSFIRICMDIHILKKALLMGFSVLAGTLLQLGGIWVQNTPFSLWNILLAYKKKYVFRVT